MWSRCELFLIAVFSFVVSWSGVCFIWGVEGYMKGCCYVWCEQQCWVWKLMEVLWFSSVERICLRVRIIGMRSNGWLFLVWGNHCFYCEVSLYLRASVVFLFVCFENAWLYAFDKLLGLFGFVFLGACWRSKHLRSSVLNFMHYSIETSRCMRFLRFFGRVWNHATETRTIAVSYWKSYECPGKHCVNKYKTVSSTIYFYYW